MSYLSLACAGILLARSNRGNHMAGWVTQEDREEMIEAFEKNRRRNRRKPEPSVVKITGQKPIEVRFLSPEELAARREGIDFGERQNADRDRPYRPGAFTMARRNG